MKVARACQQCRTSKRRCVRTESGSGTPCYPCSAKELQCSFTHNRRRSVLRPLASGSISESDHQKGELDALLSNTEAVCELVELYLAKIHDRPHSLFHPPTLRRDVQHQRVGRALLCAICSMGVRFVADDGTRRLAPMLTAETKRLLQADLENICVENIQTCILVANLSAADTNPASEALFFRIAYSMAQILDLSNPAAQPRSVVMRELRKRLWWTLFMADRWCSSGLGLPLQMTCSDRAIDLPMDESLFHSLLPDQQDLSPGEDCRPGLWAYMITLVQLFGPIQELNRRSAVGDIDSGELERSVTSLAQRLQLWEEELPPAVQFNSSNLAAHLGRGLGGPFIALHLGFHHYSTLLYFQFLETGAFPVYATRCKAHARSYSTLLQTARKEPRCEAVYPTVGHMATVSSSVLLHALLFGETDELCDARRGLNANFEALVELREYWPGPTSLHIERLVTFHNMCLIAVSYRGGQQTHQLDRWMVRFLIEHALPLTAKPLLHAAGVVMPDHEAMSLTMQGLTERGRFTDFALAGLF